MATVSALALSAVGAPSPGTQGSLVIAAGITVLLSGLSVVGTVQDAISGYPVTAAARAAIALLSAGLLCGVILGLRLGLELRLTLNPAEPVAANVARFTVSTLAAATRPNVRAGLLRAAALAARRWAGGRDRLGRLAPSPCSPTSARSSPPVHGHHHWRRHRVCPSRAPACTRPDRPVRDHPALPGLTAYRGFYQLAT